MAPKTAPTGIEYFEDPETSHFKMWFNKKHIKVPDMDSKDDLHKFVLESLIYFAASKEFPNILMTTLTPTTEQIKIINEIMAYEVSCFFLSQLDIWLYEQKHPDRQFVMTFMIECLATLAGQAFHMSIDDLRNQIHNRIDHFPTLDSYEQIAEAVAHQIVWGYGKKKPSESMPPEAYNAVSFEAGLIARDLMIGIKHNLPALQNVWSNTLLRPVCFKI